MIGCVVDARLKLALARGLCAVSAGVAMGCGLRCIRRTAFSFGLPHLSTSPCHPMEADTDDRLESGVRRAETEAAKIGGSNVRSAFPTVVCF